MGDFRIEFAGLEAIYFEGRHPIECQESELKCRDDYNFM